MYNQATFLCTDSSVYFEADRVIKDRCFYRYAKKGSTKETQVYPRDKGCKGRLHSNIWLLHILGKAYGTVTFK